MQISERHREFLTPKEEIESRLARLRAVLNDEGLSLAFFEQRADLHYFTGTAQNGILLVPADGEAVLYARKSLGRAETEAQVKVEPYPGRKALGRRIASLLSFEGNTALPYDVTPAFRYHWLRETIGQPPADITAPLRILRAVKSSWEIEQISKAAEQAETVFSEMEALIHAGQTELEASAAVEKRLRELGHPGTLRLRGSSAEAPILTLVAGASALYPTNFDGPSGGEGPFPSAPAGAGWKRIGKNETVLADMVTCHNGYFSDQTRTWFSGTELPREAAAAHDFCLSVLMYIEENMKPGRNCSGLYADTAAAAKGMGIPQGFMGFAENRVSFFGHGVGLELDEFPVLAPGLDLELQEGMVIAVEPKAYLENTGAVGLENTYVLTSSGCRSLCTSDRAIRLLRN